MAPCYAVKAIHITIVRPIEKLLLITGIGRSMYSKRRVQRLLSVAITVGMLAIIATVMMSALVIGGICAFYLSLLRYGTDPLGALLATGLIALFLTIAFLMALHWRLQQMKSLVNTPLNEVMGAFLDGLLPDQR